MFSLNNKPNIFKHENKKHFACIYIHKSEKTPVHNTIVLFEAFVYKFRCVQKLVLSPRAILPVLRLCFMSARDVGIQASRLQKAHVSFTEPNYHNRCMFKNHISNYLRFNTLLTFYIRVHCSVKQFAEIKESHNFK